MEKTRLGSGGPSALTGQVRTKPNPHNLDAAISDGPAAQMAKVRAQIAASDALAAQQAQLAHEAQAAIQAGLPLPDASGGPPPLAQKGEPEPPTINAERALVTAAIAALLLWTFF